MRHLLGILFLIAVSTGPWLAAASAEFHKDSHMPLPSKIDYESARKSWAYSTPREHPIPSVSDPAWCISPIDNFVLAKLDEHGLKPAPPADRRVLIRRAYFDLIGLPPRPEEVDAFVNDPSPDAFARVVDHLLSLPQYGQRWARHWLDVMRYTDSFDARGLDTEGDSTYAYRYRDWVVKALNQDMPYDQFIMNQIAGDLLPSPDHDGFNADGLVATSIYTIGNWPGGEADRKKMMTDLADDQVDVTGRAFLGLTLACARCHDHKFDPISQADYYGMAGIFFSTHFIPNPGSPATGVGMIRLPLAPPREVQRRQQYMDHLAEMQKQLDQFVDAQYVAQARAKLSDTDQYLVSAALYLQDDTSGAFPLVRFATDQKLNPYLLARWVNYIAPLLTARAKPMLLTKATRNVGGFAGVDAWNLPDNRPIPGVLANNTDKPVTITTLTIPPHSLSVHPGISTGIAVGWTSPITGAVRIRGGVTDADPNCGDGIDWRIELTRGRGKQTLASGTFANGSSQLFSDGQSAARLNSIRVQPGQTLQLVVYPKASYTCDSTLVDLEISAVDGAGQTWSLARDVVPDLLVGEKGNPHADQFGNVAVWSFFEAGAEEDSAAAGVNTALSEWIDVTLADNETHRALRFSAPGTVDFNATTFQPGTAMKSAAARVRDALVEFDSGPPPGASADDVDGAFYRDLIRADGPIWGDARKRLAELPSVSSLAVKKVTEALSQLRASAPPPIPQTFGLIEGGVPQSEYEGTHDVHLMTRGRYDQPGPTIPRGFPRLLTGDAPTPPLHGSGRLELARWIASVDNPMTAKVMANRIWQHHFGQGIVRTPGNFGKLGIPPTHPELLDWLARRFVEGGWSIKQLHRAMMLSSTYQQSSMPDEKNRQIDADNQWLGHMNRRRLEAEPLRDALLATTGEIDLTPDGPAFRDINIPRRTLYLLTIRSDRSNYRMLFDAADPTGIVDQRTDSTVAPQALFLLNDPFAISRAAMLADKCLQTVPSDDAARIAWLYRRLYGRLPSPLEVQIGLTTLKSAGIENSADVKSAASPAAWQQYCQVLLCSNEFIYID